VPRCLDNSLNLRYAEGLCAAGCNLLEDLELREPPAARRFRGNELKKPARTKEAAKPAREKPDSIAQKGSISGRSAPLKNTREPAGSASSAMTRGRNDADPPVKARGNSKPVKSVAEPADPTSLDPVQFPEEHKRKVKTYLSAKELREFKDLLLDKRAEILGDVQRLASQALNRNEASSSESSSMPTHMADLGSDTWEQDFTLGLLANEQNLVREIDEALARIEDKTYGICVATQQKIELPRLRAKPWAKYCIEYARAREEGRAP